MRALFGLLAIGALCLSSVGCKGYSKERATTRCDAEKAAKSTGGSFTDTSYQECLDCFQSCGDNCQAQSASPETYACQM